MHRHFFVLLTQVLFISHASLAQASSPGVATRPIATLVDFSVIADPGVQRQLQTNVNVNNATIASDANGARLVALFFHEAGISTQTKGFSCIIHVVKWASDVNNGKLIVGKSNWYVYNPQDSWTDSDFLSNKRLFGVSRPYLLVIHLAVPVPVDAEHEHYAFDYKYRVTPRLPANIQDLKDAIDLFNNSTKSVRADVTPQNYWALGQMEGDPPSDINITAAVLSSGNSTNLDSAEVKFDNEGLYRWDISIGVPIVTYKQLQSVADSTSGQQVPANVNKRDVLVLANVFLKPVDVKDSKFLSVPHIVGGVGITSQPLHTAMGGLGWGPVLANFYVGTMILTTTSPGHGAIHHYKLAFGLNFPMRALASKLGLKSQIE